MSQLQFPRHASGPRRVELAGLFDKLPPHAIEAECAVLGSIILDWRVTGDVVQVLTANDFYQASHAVIFETLVELYDQYQSIDMVQLKQRLADKQQLENVGGVDYLIELAESVPNAESVGHYARIVRDKSLLRRLIESSGRVLYECYNSDAPVGDLLDRAETDIFEIAQGRSRHDAARLDALLHEVYERIQASDGRLITGLESGFYELDELLNGMQNGEMIVVAARPSMGKTAFALNIIEHIAADRRQPAVIFSMEMSKFQLAQRLMCARSGIDSQKVRRNMLSPDDHAQLQLTVGELSDSPLFIDDTPGLTLLELRAKSRRLAANHAIKAVFIDYLQLMSSPGAESRQQEVSAISRGIKALARELNVPVVCLSQLNRASEAREGHRPRMSDLRESGSIEQDADVVMMLHREDYYHKGEEDYEPNHVAEVIVAKQRNGPTGTVKLLFHGPTVRFDNLADPQRYGGDEAVPI